MNYAVRIVIPLSIPFNCSYSWTMHYFLNNEVKHVFLIFYLIFYSYWPEDSNLGSKKKDLITSTGTSYYTCWYLIHSIKTSTLMYLLNFFWMCDNKHIFKQWCIFTHLSIMLEFTSCISYISIYSLQLIHSTQNQDGSVQTEKKNRNQTSFKCVFKQISWFICIVKKTKNKYNVSINSLHQRQTEIKPKHAGHSYNYDSVVFVRHFTSFISLLLVHLLCYNFCLQEEFLLFPKLFCNV